VLTGDLSPEHYRDLAEFRRQIRRFIHFSEAAAKESQVEPQQHQLLLAVQGLPQDVKPTIRELASRLYIQHHSAVELINRLEASGLVGRAAGPDDRREVWILLTRAGRLKLHQLAVAHRNELETSGPELARALSSVLKHSRKVMA
jgi:DNA-binding MarR family transcriptional regulator